MLFFLIFTSFVLFIFNELYWKRRNLPPGPIPIPFIGNLWSLKKQKPGYQCFSDWKKRFGPVFTFWMANNPCVIIASYEKLKETFVKDGDNYVNKRTEEESKGKNYGVIDSNGEMWSTHRRFALTELRNLGLGKDLMQEKILMEVEELFKEIDFHTGREVDLPKLLDRSVGNVMNLTLFNKRFENSQRDEFAYLKSLFDGMRDVTSQFRYFIQYLVPWTSKIIPGPTLTEKVKENRTLLDNFFNEQVEEHRKEIDFDESENSDFVEAYLKEQKKREADGDEETFSNKQLLAMCFDLWIAGLSTTSMTLSWGMSYYLHSPEVIRKIREELDTVIGENRLITTADRNNLPYMLAFLNETQRCANIIPLNFVHITARDTAIDGFSIPKGTRVIPQVSTVMTDEMVFSDPFQFNPDRFIDKNGKLKKVDELMPFSIGKRQCLGEGLARMELFLFFANLFNRYDITVGKEGLPSLDKSTDNFVIQRKFNAVLTRRHQG